MYTNTVNKDIVLKAYITAFPCGSNCAIHLKLVPDTNNTAFSSVFKRFQLRRGIPWEVMLDSFETFQPNETELFMLI